MRLDNIGQMNYNNTSKPSNLDSQAQSETVNVEERNMKLESRRQEKAIVVDDVYSEDEVIEMIEDANEEFVTYDRKFEFAIHEKTKQITVKVLDSVTDEVIRELPPEKILDMLAGIWEVAGILVDESI